MKKVVILMVTGGGGHRAGAVAVADALNHLYESDVSTSIVDITKWGAALARCLARWVLSLVGQGRPVALEDALVER